MFEPKEREVRLVVIGVRMTERERTTLKRLAKREGKSLSDFLRSCIITTLKKGASDA